MICFEHKSTWNYFAVTNATFHYTMTVTFNWFMNVYPTPKDLQRHFNAKIYLLIELEIIVCFLMFGIFNWSVTRSGYILSLHRMNHSNEQEPFYALCAESPFRSCLPKVSSELCGKSQ